MGFLGRFRPPHDARMAADEPAAAKKASRTVNIGPLRNYYLTERLAIFMMGRGPFPLAKNSLDVPEIP